MTKEYAPAWDVALRYYDLSRRRVKFNRREAVRELAAFRLFTAKEIARYVGCSTTYAERNLGVNVSSSRVWNVHATIALAALARAHDEFGEESPAIPLLVIACIREGASMQAIAELTGVPIEVVREAVIDR